MTATKTTSKGVKISIQTVDTFYATPKGCRVGSRDNRVEDVGMVFASLTKGDARKLRKALRNAGYARHAGAKRDVSGYESYIEKLAQKYAV